LVQITVSAEEVKLIKDICEPLVLAILTWAAKQSVKHLKLFISQIVISTVQTLKEDLIKTIEDHENRAFKRIDSVEAQIADLRKNQIGMEERNNEKTNYK
jgi:hypothetical protein